VPRARHEEGLEAAIGSVARTFPTDVGHFCHVARSARACAGERRSTTAASSAPSICSARAPPPMPALRPAVAPVTTRRIAAAPRVARASISSLVPPPESWSGHLHKTELM